MHILLREATTLTGKRTCQIPNEKACFACIKLDLNVAEQIYTLGDAMPPEGNWYWESAIAKLEARSF